jgi:hypothetical protein
VASGGSLVNPPGQSLFFRGPSNQRTNRRFVAHSDMMGASSNELDLGTHSNGISNVESVPTRPIKKRIR